jgi:hypothetical protein
MQGLVFQLISLLLNPLVQLTQPLDHPAYCHQNGSAYQESALD